ncbi:transcriptional regulator, LysR family [Tistlia consotensis]|uniref:Transcriptional regulator, LysR family n=1 Tax=Tistlia consotensis USBA 355 TaxID=560819 RepID=A0A1Y6CI01_9PROT|nr:LysR substrate-binding domain-containing protein [Tistlia consotensis]SMF65587.1 transcriptional regulator, LysR family [Tistlia consotensis USBA 355]SNS03539.1 transcriptional regulator, LysR family [Tistlia consotensis]
MTVRTLDPELLRAFVAVAERLSFTRAAEGLHRSQATVSLQVKRLEARLGVALFRRSTTRVELTAAGIGFLADARRILAMNEAALARLDGQRLAGQVRIGVMEDYGTRLLPPLLAKAAERFPLVRVEVEIGLTARMVGRLGRDFDLVIAMHPEGEAEGELLARETPLWVAAEGHAAEAIEPLPVALSNPDCLFRAWALAALERGGRPWRLAYVSASLAAIEALVRQGLAVTVVKGSLPAPGLRALPAGGRLPALPGAEIRLHRAPGLDAPGASIADHLAEGLRRRAAG